MENIEVIIRMVYKFLKKKKQEKDQALCPDEERLVLFLEGKASFQESKNLQKHILSCTKCAEILYLFSLKEKNIEVPDYLLEKVKALIIKDRSVPFWFEILLMLKEKGFQIVKTTADILMGNEILPLPVLRNRVVDQDFHQLSLIKEIEDIQINIEIARIKRTAVKLELTFLNKKTLNPLEDIRVGLFKDNLELESYTAKKGKVVFVEVNLGSYFLKISHSLKDIGLIKFDLI